jgi:hypothetical protein
LSKAANHVSDAFESLSLVDVSWGSIATEVGLPRDVRFPSNSDHPRTSLVVRFVPNPEVGGPYSITSSARMSNVGGTPMPSCFAVLRLITSSNLVGCTTGSSEGFSPFRMRPT